MYTILTFKQKCIQELCKITLVVLSSYTFERLTNVQTSEVYTGRANRCPSSVYFTGVYFEVVNYLIGLVDGSI